MTFNHLEAIDQVRKARDARRGLGVATRVTGRGHAPLRRPGAVGAAAIPTFGTSGWWTGDDGIAVTGDYRPGLWPARRRDAIYDGPSGLTVNDQRPVTSNIATVR